MSREYPCIYFEKDGKCRKFSDDNTLSYCVMGPCQEQTLSNADRIRAMSDEALANFLCGLFECGDCPYEDQCKTEILREWADGWLNWLRQPAEKDNND